MIWRSICFVLATCSAAPNSWAQSAALESQSLPAAESPTVALTSLIEAQKTGHAALVDQAEMNALIHSGGGGACPSAAAVDAIQALRLMAGLEQLENPHKAVLAAFTDAPALLDGRLTNEQFVALLRFYESDYLDGRTLEINVELPPRGPYSPTRRNWSESDGPDLEVQGGELKIVTFSVTLPSGELIGRHFVLVKESQDQAIVVLDPGKPTTTLRYIVSDKLGAERPSGHFYLLQAPGAPARDRIFEINAVFTVTLQDHGAESESRHAPADLSVLKTKIDETASRLKESGELRSPRKWRQMSAAFGLPGLDLPVEQGGSGWPASKVLEVFLHAGRHDLNCRDVVGGAHARPLRRSANPEMQEIVAKVATGEAYMAITMTEPHAGSDFYAITSSAETVDGGYLLTGEKRYVARLEQATHVIIFTQPASGERGLSAFVLPMNTPGLEPYSFEAHGLKGNSFGGLKFKDVFVREEQMLGNDGDGDDIFFDHFRYWRLMQSAAALGSAERALEMMAERLVSRQAYGGPIGRFSHLQQAMGQSTTELRMAKALAREAASLLDAGKGVEADPLINGLKAEGVEMALRAVDAATRAFGAEGYSGRVDLGDRLQDLNGLRIADGTTDVMRMAVVRGSYKEGEQLWKMAVRRE